MATVSSGVITGINKGNTTLTIAAAGDNNYNAASITVKITVTEAAVSPDDSSDDSSGSGSTGSDSGSSTAGSGSGNASGSYQVIATIASGSTVSYTDKKVKSKKKVKISK